MRMTSLGSRRGWCAALLAVAALLCVGSGASAGVLNGGQLPTITWRLENGEPGESATWVFGPTVNMFAPAPEGGYELTSTPTFDLFDGLGQVTVQELAFDPDPFVLNNLLVTNTSNTTQTFSAFVGLPTTFGAPNTISGHVQVGLIDGGTDGATISTVSGSPLYAAQVDFATVATLLDDPFSLTAPAGGSSNAGPVSFGPTVSGIPVNSNIGVQLRFTLSPGDTASILSRFDVVAVPEPAAMASAGLVGLALLRRRRSA